MEKSAFVHPMEKRVQGPGSFLLLEIQFLPTSESADSPGGSSGVVVGLFAMGRVTKKHKYVLEDQGFSIAIHVSEISCWDCTACMFLYVCGQEEKTQIGKEITARQVYYLEAWGQASALLFTGRAYNICVLTGCSQTLHLTSEKAFNF